MADLLFVALTIAFFGLAAALVRACERVVGPDPEPEEPTERRIARPDAEVAAP